MAHFLCHLNNFKKLKSIEILNIKKQTIANESGKIRWPKIRRLILPKLTFMNLDFGISTGAW